MLEAVAYSSRGVVDQFLEPLLDTISSNWEQKPHLNFDILIALCA